MSQPTPNSLTVVLVHGAFADSSSWAGVIERLHAKGTKLIAAANPLRGLKSDSAYLAAVIDEIPGPVLAVGHSYGGAVISNAERAGADITKSMARTWSCFPSPTSSPKSSSRRSPS